LRHESTPDFSVHVIGVQVWDPLYDNVDVEVQLRDGRRFGATFFTLTNIQRLFEKNRNTGECASGLYLWAANMILVRDLSMATIEGTVEDLMAMDEFENAFSFLGKD
jgi:hypothetical protein